MQDLMKSFSDLEKEEEKKTTPSPPPPKLETPPPQPPVPPKKETATFSNLEAIKRAIQENLGGPAAKLLTTEKPGPSPTAAPVPPASQDASHPQPTKPQMPFPPPAASPTPPPPKQVSPAFVPPPTNAKPEPEKSPAPPEKVQTDDEVAATQLYLDLHREIAGIIQLIKEKKPIHPRPLMGYIPQIIESVKHDEYLFLKAIQRKRYASWLISHSVNVAIFAIKVGIGLKYEREKLQRLGLAALLHDVGMTAVPNSIIFKHGKLTPSEFEVVKEHPLHGFELVKHLKEEYPFLPEVVLQEQEREDGSGYPQGLSGENIHEFAKIIGIVDVFEALVHGRAYREGFITYNAIQKIIEQRAKQFNVKFVRALINSVTMFPVGSLVKLSTDEVARVISVNSLRPMRPVVDVLIDADGIHLKSPVRINLEEEPLIYIVKPIEEE